MRQATQPAFYTTADGSEVFIKAGTVRPDGHPDVQHVPGIFRPVDIEEPSTVLARPVKPKPAVKPAPRGAAGKP